MLRSRSFRTNEYWKQQLISTEQFLRSRRHLIRLEAELSLELFSGADAPNVFIPMMRPDLLTYRSHPKVDACSTATRAVTCGGSIVSVLPRASSTVSRPLLGQRRSLHSPAELDPPEL